MPPRLLRHPPFVVLLTAFAASAQERPAPSDWTVTVGAGAVARPSYPGAASLRVLPLPLLDVRYRDLFFFNPITGSGMNVISGPLGRVGFAIRPDFGRSASGGDRLRGWGDIGAGADGSVFGAVNLGLVGLLADVHHQFGAGNGTLLGGSVTSGVPLWRSLFLSATARLTWADGRYTDSYYGVAQGQAAAALAFGNSLPTFSADGGFRDVSLTLTALYRINKHWSLNAFGQLGRLLGDAARSPLTEQRLQTAFGGFLGYTL